MAIVKRIRKQYWLGAGALGVVLATSACNLCIRFGNFTSCQPI